MESKPRIDDSDVQLWAASEEAQQFFGEVEELRDKALRDVVSHKCKDRNEAAAIVRAWDKVLAKFHEARNDKH